MVGCRTPFGLWGPSAEPPLVVVNSVTNPFPPQVAFAFDTNIVGYNTVPDPVFEVWTEAGGWGSPVAFVGKTLFTIRYGYSELWWNPTFFRILSQPTQVWWTPQELAVPTQGDIPGP